MKDMEALRDLTICCVEDDSFALQNLVEYLSYLCSDIISCNNAYEAQKAIETRDPDIVITDINMPQMSGLELLAWIKQERYQAKTILMSAYFEPELFTEAIELKADHFLMKPFNKEELLKALKSSANAIFLKRQADNNSMIKNVEKSLYIDSVTNLPNHNKLLVDIEKSVNPTLIIFEVVGFEQIDEIYGTEIANMLLKQVAGFFAVQVPDEQSLYRYQYNQFAMLIENFSEYRVKDLITAFDNLILLSHFEAYGISVYFTLHYGICMEKNNIIEKAHKALLQTKTTPNQRYCFYNRDSAYIVQQRKNIIYGMKIKNAIETFNVFAYYQPILNLKSNKIEKYEALMRMKDEGTMLSPGDFIPVGKHMGLHSALTKQMVNQSFKKFANFDKEIAINLSLEDFDSNDIPFFIRKRIKDFGIPPKNVILEVTEDISLHEHEHILQILEEFKRSGVKVAIDDFGTNMANFQNLCKIEPDYIKIDGMFIKDMDTNEKNYEIVKGIVTVAQNIGALTIAEYVHNEDILNIVQNLGIDYAQGFLIGVPSNNIEGCANE
jgi:EAL domain-containing protein (putative c-di-GMP-specific phosphodiesterase class I)/CheY-like chemotaxis protein